MAIFQFAMLTRWYLGMMIPIPLKLCWWFPQVYPWKAQEWVVISTPTEMLLYLNHRRLPQPLKTEIQKVKTSSYEAVSERAVYSYMRIVYHVYHILEYICHPKKYSRGLARMILPFVHCICFFRNVWFPRLCDSQRAVKPYVCSFSFSQTMKLLFLHADRKTHNNIFLTLMFKNQNIIDSSCLLINFLCYFPFKRRLKKWRFVFAVAQATWSAWRRCAPAWIWTAAARCHWRKCSRASRHRKISRNWCTAWRLDWLDRWDPRSGIFMYFCCGW